MKKNKNNRSRLPNGTGSPNGARSSNETRSPNGTRLPNGSRLPNEARSSNGSRLPNGARSSNGTRPNNQNRIFHCNGAKREDLIRRRLQLLRLRWRHCEITKREKTSWCTIGRMLTVIMIDVGHATTMSRSKYYYFHFRHCSIDIRRHVEQQKSPRAPPSAPRTTNP